MSGQKEPHPTVTTKSSMKLKQIIEATNEVLPMVGMVVTISPSFSLYRIVVLPAASRPTITQRSRNLLMPLIL